MSYFVSFGGIVLHCVESVSETSGRDIEEHKSLAGEAFPTAGGANLREWTISCVLSNVNDFKDPNWKSADEIFKQFEICLKTKDYSRFIMTSSGKASVSELTWLERYSKKEKYDGVWDVEITLKEYRPVQIMTANVPTITRPGKNPNPPKTVGNNTAYGAGKANTGNAPQINEPVKGLTKAVDTVDKARTLVKDTVQVVDKLGKWKNPLFAVSDDKVEVIELNDEARRVAFNNSAQGVASAAKAMSDAIEKFKENQYQNTIGKVRDGTAWK